MPRHEAVDFDYERRRDVCRRLADGRRGKIIAGGQTLGAAAGDALGAAGLVIDINRIDALRGIAARRTTAS